MAKAPKRAGPDWKAIAEKRTRQLEDEQVHSGRVAIEYDDLVRHLRAVVENCKTATPEMIRHQLVGLLPECQEMEPELIERMREKGLGHLAARHEANVRDAWAQYGYGSGSKDAAWSRDPQIPPAGSRQSEPPRNLEVETWTIFLLDPRPDGVNAAVSGPEVRNPTRVVRLDALQAEREKRRKLLLERWSELGAALERAERAERARDELRETVSDLAATYQVQYAAAYQEIERRLDEAVKERDYARQQRDDEWARRTQYVKAEAERDAATARVEQAVKALREIESDRRNANFACAHASIARAALAYIQSSQPERGAEGEAPPTERS